MDSYYAVSALTLSICLVAYTAIAICAAQSDGEQDIPLVLAVTWPQGYCRNGTVHGGRYRCAKDFLALKRWPIYRLWTNALPIPERDCEAEFNGAVNAVRAIKGLGEMWPPIEDSEHDRAVRWKFAYILNGCAMLGAVPGIDTVVDYFNKVIELYRTVDPEQKLKRAGITPSNAMGWNYSQIRDAFDGKKVDMVVLYEPFKEDYHVILTQLLICLKGSTNPVVVDCPNVQIPDKQVLYYLADHSGRIESSD